MKLFNSIARNALPVLTAAFAQLACLGCWAGDETPGGKKNETPTIEQAPKVEVIEIPGREGKLSYRASVIDGKLDGLSEQWWDDGTRMSRRNFRQGVMVDSSYSWDMEGRIHEISVFEDGNPISTESWNSEGVKTFKSVRVKDSTYHIMRWNDAGEKTKDTLVTRPKVRWIKDPPSKD